MLINDRDVGDAGDLDFLMAPMDAQPGSVVALGDGRTLHINTRAEAEALARAASWLATNWQADHDAPA